MYMHIVFKTDNEAVDAKLAEIQELRSKLSHAIFDLGRLMDPKATLEPDTEDRKNG